MGTLLPCLQKINLLLQQSSLFSFASMVFVRTNTNLKFKGYPLTPLLKKKSLHKNNYTPTKIEKKTVKQEKRGVKLVYT